MSTPAKGGAMRYVVSWAHPHDGHVVSEIVEADDAKQAMSRCEARFGVSGIFGARPESSAMTWTPCTMLAHMAPFGRHTEEER